MQTRTDAFFSSNYAPQNRNNNNNKNNNISGINGDGNNSPTTSFRRVYDRKGSQPHINHPANINSGNSNGTLTSPHQISRKNLNSSSGSNNNSNNIGVGTNNNNNNNSKTSSAINSNNKKMNNFKGINNNSSRVRLAASPSLLNENTAKLFRQRDGDVRPSPVKMSNLNPSSVGQNISRPNNRRIKSDNINNNRIAQQNMIKRRMSLQEQNAMMKNYNNSMVLYQYGTVANQCNRIKMDLKELKRSVLSECRSTGSFIENSMAEITKKASLYENDRARLRQRLAKMERANGLLMRELIQTKETLADVQSERDVLIDELKLCEKLGGAPIHALKARGQELAAMRARAVLANTRERERRQKNNLGIGGRKNSDDGNDNDKDDGKDTGEDNNNNSNLNMNEKVNSKDNKRINTSGKASNDNDKGKNKNDTDTTSSSSAKESDDIKAFFYRCINNSFLLIQIDDIEFNQLLSHLRTGNGREAFAYALHRHKLPDNEPPKSVSESAFEMISYLMKECLDQCSNATPPDYRVAQMLMSMEMSFCMPGKAGEDDFIFLNQRISKNAIWKDVAFWEEAFFSALESIRKVDASQFPNLTPAEQRRFIENEQSVVLQLIYSFKLRMQKLKVKKKSMNALLIRLCKIHDIPEGKIIPIGPANGQQQPQQNMEQQEGYATNMNSIEHPNNYKRVRDQSIDQIDTTVENYTLEMHDPEVADI